MAYTASVSLSSKTETTLTMKWTASATMSRISYRYKTGSGSYTQWTRKTVSAKTGTFKISGLSAYTSYTIETEFMDSSSLTTTKTSTVRTYNWPYATPSDFSVKSGIAPITVHNPLGRSITMEVYANGGDEPIFTETGEIESGATEYSIFPEDWLAACTDSLTAEWSVKVTYGVHEQTRTANYDLSGYAPRFTMVSYADTNQQVQAIIQDPTVLLQNFSTPRFTIRGTAQYDATIAGARVDILNAQATGTAVGDTVTVDCSTINSATWVIATVTLFDSRGASTSTTVTVSMVQYYQPSALITLQRHNNYYSETDIKVDGSVMIIDPNTPTISVKCKEVGASTWETWAGVVDNVTSTKSLDNTKDWDIQVTVSDSFGGSRIYNLTLGIGLPILFIDRILRAIGVNKFPTEDGEITTSGRISGKKIDPEELTIGGAIDGSDSISDVTLSSGTSMQNIGSFDLTTGTWDVHVYCRFGSQTTGVGRRLITIANTSGGNDGASWDRVAANAVSGTYTYLHLHTWLKVTGASKTFYINGYQNSGSSLSVLTRWGAVRLSTT